MKNSYFDLIEQSYYFPQEGFDLRNNFLTFHGVSLKHLIEKHGTPFRFIYLPKIGDQIKKARNLFNRAIKNNAYRGRYNFCYCTKCNHFFHVVHEALKHNVDLETSSSFDIDLTVKWPWFPTLSCRYGLPCWATNSKDRELLSRTFAKRLPKRASSGSVNNPWIFSEGNIFIWKPPFWCNDSKNY